MGKPQTALLQNKQIRWGSAPAEALVDIYRNCSAHKDVGLQADVHLRSHGSLWLKMEDSQARVWVRDRVFIVLGEGIQIVCSVTALQCAPQQSLESSTRASCIGNSSLQSAPSLSSVTHPLRQPKNGVDRDWQSSSHEILKMGKRTISRRM